MFLLASADDTQRFLRCELCRKFEPEASAMVRGWFKFESLADSHYHLYACPECFHPDRQESYVLMGRALVKTIPQPPPLTLEELGL